MNPLKHINTLRFLLLATLFLAGCKKETETLQPELPKAYVSTQPGKYITYRLDSTVFVNFGLGTEVHSYQEKQTVDSMLTDNLGRPSYRVYRYIRDAAGTLAWKPSGSSWITVTANNIEVIENNLRFLKLTAPVQEGKDWQGNRFLPNDTYGAFYDFGNDDDMSSWTYTYTATDGSINLAGKSYANVTTVEKVDPLGDSTNVKTGFQVENTQLFGFKNRLNEKYAKGLGLIYQEYVMWEYQPPSSPRPGYRGFGVKRSIIDNN